MTGVAAIFHVSDGPALSSLSPRPAPAGAPRPAPAGTPRPALAGTPHEGRALVWGVDDKHLANYLVPRDCPRVCWVPPAAEPGVLGSPSGRVVAIEQAWLPRVMATVLRVHELDPAHFRCLDEVAGYWVAEQDVAVRRVRTVDDCAAALAERGVELRVTASLWPYVDAVVAQGGEFSIIRIRNAGRDQKDDRPTRS